MTEDSLDVPMDSSDLDSLGSRCRPLVDIEVSACFRPAGSYRRCLTITIYEQTMRVPINSRHECCSLQFSNKVTAIDRCCNYIKFHLIFLVSIAIRILTMKNVSITVCGTKSLMKAARDTAVRRRSYPLLFPVTALLSFCLSRPARSFRRSHSHSSHEARVTVSLSRGRSFNPNR